MQQTTVGCIRPVSLMPVIIVNPRNKHAYKINIIACLHYFMNRVAVQMVCVFAQSLLQIYNFFYSGQRGLTCGWLSPTGA